MVFGLVKVTFDLLKEQSKYDEIMSDLAIDTGTILSFSDRVLEDALCDEMETIEPSIKDLCNLAVEAATFICEYIKKSSANSLLDSITPSEDKESIRNLRIPFKKLNEDLDAAVSGATLRAVSDIENDLLLKRLGPTENANYQGDRGCMDGTRTQVINDIIIWATEQLGKDVPPQYFNIDRMLWVYGMPGIGKSAIANSICRRLDDMKQLGGSFFCRRDDPARSETKSVLPTLIYRLARMYGPYRNRVAQALRDDLQLMPQLASGELFLSSLRSLNAHPSRALVLVVDAFDECGDPDTRRQVLGHLLKACQRNQWLKAIVISRPEHDIRSFFNTNDIVGRDLGQDDNSRTDIRHFTEVRMKMVADKRQVSQDPEPWVGERRLGLIVNRSGGLFIFVETLSQYLMRYRNPKPPLDRLLEGPSEEASIELHKLYLAAIESRVNAEEAESRLISRAVIGVAPHRALCDESIAAFTGLEIGIVISWVDDLSSLLYRDKTIQNGIRVRHISILEYFTGRFCPLDFRVDVKQADVELSTYSLQTMMRELRFNICGLETSCLPNSDINNLSERVRENISDILQYSCLHWSSHLCANLDPASTEICQLLDSFLRGERFLYWLEVLSVMGKVPTAIVSLRRIIACSRKFDELIVNLAKDGLRFVLAFLAPISTSAPHIYLSALPFTPSESSLWKAAYRLFPNLMSVSEGRMTEWPGSSNLWKAHTDSVNGIAYSSDGLTVVSCSDDKTVRIWDAATGAPVGEPLKGHTSYVESVTYSPDGRKIISGSSDKTIRIWDASTGAPIGEPLRGHRGRVVSLACSPDSRYIISGSHDHTIRMWDAETGTPIGDPLKGHTGDVESVACSPNGRNIVSGDRDGTIRIWDLATGSQIGEPLEGHTGWGWVANVAYSPDGHIIISRSSDNTMRTWDAMTGVLIGEPLKLSGGLTSVSYSPDGQKIATCIFQETVRIWDIETGNPVNEPLKGHTSLVPSIAYSPDGRYIVSGFEDGTIRMWDIDTKKPITGPPMGHTMTIFSVAYSPDGHNIVTGSGDMSIRIWDAATGTPIGEPLKGHTNYVRSITYSPDGRNIISGSYDKTVRIWDAATGALVGGPLKGHTNIVGSVTYSPDGRKIVSGSGDMTIRIWDAVTGAPVGEPLKGHTDSVTSVAYSPNGQNIVSGSGDGTILIWDAATLSLISGPLTGHTKRVASIAYSPDGRNFVSGSWDNTIRVWDAATGAPVSELLKGHAKNVNSVAYSPDGRNIVSGSSDNMIRIWDVVTGVPLGDPLKGHTNEVNSIAYSSDGRNIVSVSLDRTIRIWDAQQIPNNGRTASLRLLDFPPRFLDHLVFHSSGSGATSSISLVPGSIDTQGWVRGEDGILMWIPEDCRRGLMTHTIRIIPPDALQRGVRLDLSNFKYGKSWTDAYYSM
ncbi:hypothetical protein M408DRAFT_176560 [Serendipita vermifera MAFF 305830]|uniref:Nephrocystin 3-like N-terminal domain-containing protein n=1 Tax=Serendipita vermifera MAFF 305830 TaxID=933852 RepID=A0A0C3B491_SERVB|nr:hypothetical protein M408DRAFT_176560 [Serendipita vermifera MAFF 305830]